MNVIVVDTSSWITYFNGIPNDDVDTGLKEGRIYLAPIVASELLSARLKQSDRSRMVDFLKELPLCNATFEHWTRVGELRARLSANGLNISTPDAHVAQCAIDLQGYLLCDDAIFRKVAAKTTLRLLAD